MVFEKFIGCLVFVCVCLIPFGCTKIPDAEETYLEFEIVLREEAVEQKPDFNAGTFHVVSKHQIPVVLGSANAQGTSVVDGVWMDFKWSYAEIRKDSRLWLTDWQYRIRNKLLFEKNGGGMGWCSARGDGFTSEWKHVNSLGSVTTNSQGPLLYHRIRWTKPNPAAPDVEMSEFYDKQ